MVNNGNGALAVEVNTYIFDNSKSKVKNIYNFQPQNILDKVEFLRGKSVVK